IGADPRRVRDAERLNECGERAHVRNVGQKWALTEPEKQDRLDRLVLPVNSFGRRQLDIAMTAVPVHVISDAERAASVLHPLRVCILSELGQAESAAELARRLGVPRQLVNYHLRQLETDGLVEAVGERRNGNCTERLVRAVAGSYLMSPSALRSRAAAPRGWLGPWRGRPCSARPRSAPSPRTRITSRIARRAPTSWLPQPVSS